MKLLVSVRSAAEAVAALEGGADLIDVKEPGRGPLGKADDEVISAVFSVVAGRVPVSAAMGELKDAVDWKPPGVPLAFLKWGLQDCLYEPWRERLLELRETASSIVVPVAYADDDEANSPPVEDVTRFVVEHRFPVILIDTYWKEGANLFSRMSTPQLKELVEHLREQRVSLALAGSLTPAKMKLIRHVAPEWAGVRGAVCGGDSRENTVERELVKRFKRETFDQPAASAAPVSSR
jgi:uncharacterized protein (UPF0264 family)